MNATKQTKGFVYANDKVSEWEGSRARVRTDSIKFCYGPGYVELSFCKHFVINHHNLLEC